MSDEITVQELSESIEALKHSLTSMREMRARVACPVRPGDEIRVGRRGTLTRNVDEPEETLGRTLPHVARHFTPVVLVHGIAPIDTPPYYKLVVREQSEDGWHDDPVWLEVEG